MADDQTELEEKFKKVADRLHRGWAKLYPPTEKDLAAVQEAIREHWEQEQQALELIKRGKQAATFQPPPPEPPEKKIDKDQSQQSNRHRKGHSY